MFNLTCNEDSAIDVGGIWTGPEHLELTFRFSRDDQPDFIVDMTLNSDEVTELVEYLQFKLTQVKGQ